MDMVAGVAVMVVGARERGSGGKGNSGSAAEKFDVGSYLNFPYLGLSAIINHNRANRLP